VSLSIDPDLSSHEVVSKMAEIQQLQLFSCTEFVAKARNFLSQCSTSSSPCLRLTESESESDSDSDTFQQQQRLAATAHLIRALWMSGLVELQHLRLSSAQAFYDEATELYLASTEIGARQQISKLLIDIYGMDRGLHTVMLKYQLQMLIGEDLNQSCSMLPMLPTQVLQVNHVGGATQGLVAHIYLSMATLLLPPSIALEQARMIVGGSVAFNFANACNRVYLQLWASAKSMAQSEDAPTIPEVTILFESVDGLLKQYDREHRKDPPFGILLMGILGMSAPLLLAESLEAFCAVLDKFVPIAQHVESEAWDAFITNATNLSDQSNPPQIRLRSAAISILNEHIERHANVVKLSQNASAIFSAVRCHWVLARLQWQQAGSIPVVGLDSEKTSQSSQSSRTTVVERLKELETFLRSTGYQYLASETAKLVGNPVS